MEHRLGEDHTVDAAAARRRRAFFAEATAGVRDPCQTGGCQRASRRKQGGACAAFDRELRRSEEGGDTCVCGRS
jgi:hypothetical protein